MGRYIERGDIYYISNCPVVGSEMFAGRPGIVVSNEMQNKSSEVVAIVYLTTRPKTKLPTHVAINSAKLPSTALCEQITAVSVERIGDYCGHCTNEEMQQLDKAMAIALGLDLGIEPSKEQMKGVTPYSDDAKALAIRAEAERDAYKTMYEQLLAKAIRLS